MGQNMLNISRLRLGYGEKVVLDFAGMQLSQGQQCLITGASGCGKTSLLYAIAGLLDVMEGSIQVAGTDIAKLSQSERDRFRGKRIGMIFQTLHLVKSLSVIDNLMLASYVAGVPQHKEHAHGLLKQLGIYEKRDALPSQLSQGQAQRVAIARAVLHHPELLLADEPTSSLDDDACEAVITLIQKVAKDNGAALLVSTHDARVKKYFSEILPLGGAA